MNVSVGSRCPELAQAHSSVALAWHHARGSTPFGVTSIFCASLAFKALGSHTSPYCSVVKSPFLAPTMFWSGCSLSFLLLLCVVRTEPSSSISAKLGAILVRNSLSSSRTSSPPGNKYEEFDLGLEVVWVFWYEEFCSHSSWNTSCCNDNR